ncbi:unnamed protein product [Acanthoscelides obtectus]|uniref:Uncharacterized protein n=1 Tax=Acanthoscelides obtectus TaxID=200917 RepID=A0A9P0KGF1_ACAOB|nr:unnamed protein product [Acanthoscelides obtectus]CAK1632504.1 hypothetical protein AOBTE_LOCUS7601 [Acanthoscelides obtectus]
MSENNNFVQTLEKREDYYGDLDLKSIRKSELLAGLASSDGGRNKDKGNTNANANIPKKPRPAPASRNAPEPQGNN